MLPLALKVEMFDAPCSVLFSPPFECKGKRVNHQPFFSIEEGEGKVFPQHFIVLYGDTLCINDRLLSSFFQSSKGLSSLSMLEPYVYIAIGKIARSSFPMDVTK